tara:strand:- start:100 stop:300 length:201 start_codon:yes stop_codon:yes gene_type:complete
MTTPKIIDRITAIKDLFAEGEIGSEELIEHMDDLLIDIKNGDGGFAVTDDDYYETFEETDFTMLEI